MASSFSIAIVMCCVAMNIGCSDREGNSGRGTFGPGQVWVYDCRPGEEASRLTVCLIEPDQRHRNIVHVAVDGLKLSNPGSPTGFSDRVGHMAFHESALQRSVRKLESSDQPVPAFYAGYEEWRKANGGAWDVSVAEAIEAIESVLTDSK